MQNPLIEIRDSYRRGEISRPDFSYGMQPHHRLLAQYAEYMKGTAIASVTISDDQTVFTTRTHGVKIACDPNDVGIPPIVALNLGDYEKVDGAMLLQLVDDGMNFFDLGANLGWYGLHVAKLFPASRVFAFEPIPKTFSFLEKNVALNGLDNMRVFPWGLFNEASERVFFVNPAIMGAASTSEMAGGAGEAQRCTVRTLDAIVNELGVSIDFIKIDVEGAELFVFQGGIKEIERSKPIIFTEMLRKHSATFHYHPNDIIALLEGFGYHCFMCCSGGLSRFRSMDENTVETNFVFLHVEKHRAKIQEMTTAALHTRDGHQSTA